jgi:hypothetical protein
MLTSLGSRWRKLRAIGALGLVAPAMMAIDWSTWRDLHVNYPSRPSGYNQIVNRFGEPCGAPTHAITRKWEAANGTVYNVTFHRKLGGMKTSILNDQDGRSTNLDNDVWGHINVRGDARYLKHGIYGYNCRFIKGTTTWSTHAWGIAVDVSAAFEPYGACSSTVNYHHADVWKRHGWIWGLAFCDPMHFQYADSY